MLWIRFHLMRHFPDPIGDRLSVRQNRTFDAQPSGQLLRAGFDLVSSQGPDRTTHCCLGRGPCAHLTWTFSGSILVLHGLSEPSGWPSAGCLEVNKCTVFCRNIRRNIKRYWISRRICRSISCSASFIWQTQGEYTGNARRRGCGAALLGSLSRSP